MGADVAKDGSGDEDTAEVPYPGIETGKANIGPRIVQLAPTGGERYIAVDRDWDLRRGETASLGLRRLSLPLANTPGDARQSGAQQQQRCRLGDCPYFVVVDRGAADRRPRYGHSRIEGLVVDIHHTELKRVSAGRRRVVGLNPPAIPTTNGPALARR